MSEQKNIISITPPDFGTGEEHIEIDGVFYCGRCRGMGFFWGTDGKEAVKVKCDKCGGTGEVKASVTVSWEPAGKLKSYFQE